MLTVDSPVGDPDKNGFVELTIRQVQEGDAFLNPITVEIISVDGAQRVTLTPKAKDTTARIPVSHPPTMIAFDPDQTILKEIVLVRRD